MDKLLDDVRPSEWDTVNKMLADVQPHEWEPVTKLAHPATLGTKKDKADMVNSPAHYTYGTIESIQAIEASMEASAFKGFLKGNVLKYLWRYERKNGVEDLRKADWYLRRLIEVEAGL